MVYGIGRSLLSWFRSYLVHRIQTLKLNSVPNSSHVLPGIGQRPLLGPSLLILFINYMTKKYYLVKFFADDAKLFMLSRLP